MKDRFTLSASELVLVPGMPSLLIVFIPRHVFRIVGQANFAQLVVFHILRQVIEVAVLNVILKPEEQVTVWELHALPDDSLFAIGIFIIGFIMILPPSYKYMLSQEQLLMKKLQISV